MELAEKVVLLTGVTGFVGSRMVRPLLQAGMHVRALVRRPVEIAGVEPVLGDLLDPAVVQRGRRSLCTARASSRLGTRVARSSCG